MYPNANLELLCSKEACHDILDALTPWQFIVLFLRSEFSLRNREVAERLGVTNSDVSMAITAAKKRVALTIGQPDLINAQKHLSRRPLHRVCRECGRLISADAARCATCNGKRAALARRNPKAYAELIERERHEQTNP